MGVALKDLVKSKEISMQDLSGKVVAIDSYNTLYQFITTIRGQDGTPLMDSHGNVTSHLVGLFSRTANFMQNGIKPVFVFDGEMPALKRLEIERRSKVKAEAEEKYKEALQKEDISSMKKYAGRTSKLTYEMVRESKRLIDAMGLPIVQAPQECDGQIAFMVNKGYVFAGVSQDYDCLLHGTKTLVRNLSISGKKKKTGTLSYEVVAPEMIILSENLSSLGLTQEQLICLGMLIGTDYNPKGIRGIGPQKALKIVKDNIVPEKIFEKVEWNKSFDFSWESAFELFNRMKTTDEFDLNQRSIRKERVTEILCEEHDFSKQRAEETIQRIEKVNEKKKQSSLGEFF